MSTPTASNPTRPTELKTRGYVLRRTNYGEADRILNLITPEGKFAVIAKGARKSRSKLAGGIEMFTLSDYHIRFGRSEFGTLTSAKLLTYHSEIVKDFARMELAATILKRLGRAADSTDSPDYFYIADQSLSGLNYQIDICLIEAWFHLRLAAASGEEPNLYRDLSGTPLSADCRYRWHATEACFVKDSQGPYDANAVKLLRLLLKVDLTIATRIKLTNELLHLALEFARTIS